MRNGLPTVLRKGISIMCMTSREKELLAERVVEILRSDDPKAALSELNEKVDSGDEGPDGLNSTVLAISQALLEHLKR